MDESSILLGYLTRLLPEHEKADAHQLLQSVIALEGFVRNFYRALQLYEISAEQHTNVGREYTARRKEIPLDVIEELQKDIEKKRKLTEWVREEEGRLQSWMTLACRDGAFQIYHLAKVMEVVVENLRYTPTLLSIVDSAKLRVARKLARGYFPHWQLIRDGVGHSTAELMPTAARRKYHSGASGFIISGIVNRRHYVVTMKNQIASFEMCERTLHQMDEVRSHFIDGFSKAMEMSDPRRGNPQPLAPVPRPESG